MKGLKKFDPTLRRVLKKMCSIAKVDPETVDFKKDGWYSKHTWTEKQQDKFKDWFVDLLVNNPSACCKLYGHRAWNKKWARSAWSWFNLDYGWKIVEAPKP